MFASTEAGAARVLIYRLGSIGDTVVALPALRTIARAFPVAERRLLTNFPVHEKAAPIDALLAGTDLVHSYIRYPLSTRSIVTLARLSAEIRAWRPDVLVYLAATRGIPTAVRDWLFFRACGIRRIVGVPLKRSLQENRPLADGQLYESEAHRLARCIDSLGTTELENSDYWNLALAEPELHAAARVLSQWNPGKGFIAASVGTKASVKDWGVENWSSFAARLSSLNPHLGLVMVGSREEAPASEVVMKAWRGHSLNTCGTLTVRESAAMIARSLLFVGHDSGPMHLAAATGVPCVAIFSARNKPGVWFPNGAHHVVIYHKTECFDCGLDKCEVQKKKCILSIGVDEVLQQVMNLLASRLANVP